MIEPVQMTPAAGSERRSCTLVVLLIAISLASDFLMVLILALVPALPIVFAPVLLAAVGCTLAQGCLLAAWLAWSDLPFWQRFLQHWLVATLLYLVWVAGLAFGQPNKFRQLSVMVGLAVPLISIAAQLPLWIARQLCGWRLIRTQAHAGTRHGSLSIRDLMLATVVVAVALALARLAPSPDGEPMGMLWVNMFAAATTTSTLTLLPVGPLLLRTPRFGRGVWIACLYAAFWIGLARLIVLSGWSRGLFPPPPLAVMIGLSWFIVSFAATVILAAAVARSWGYQLQSGRLRRRRVDLGV